MISLLFETPKEIQIKIAARARARRKEKKLSMEKLAEISDVSYGSIRRFESKGEISLSSLLKIAAVLDCADEFHALFAKQTPTSIEEIINGKL